MKKMFVVLLCSFIFYNAAAQNNSDDNKEKEGFRQDNIFLGGGITLGFYTGSFTAGATPEIGYSFADWLDAGFGFNLIYVSQRADPYYNGNIRQRDFNYGGGPFFRVYPIHFLFVQGQLEANWIKVSLKDFYTNQTLKATLQSTSFIAGIGYTQRVVGQSSFYTMLGIDLLSDPDSPYRDYNNAAVPIVRVGFDVYLRPSRKK